MRIVALASARCVAQLRRVIGDGDTLRRADTLIGLKAQMDAGGATVALVDLEECAATDLPCLEALVARHTTSIVVYLRLTGPGCQRVIQLAHHGLARVVSRGFDDSPPSMLRALREAEALSLGIQVIGRLSVQLSRVSGDLRGALEGLFREPLTYRDAGDLAIAAGVSRRSLDRALRTVELEPARTFVLAAHLTWAYPRIRSRGATVCEISRQLGASKPERLTKHMRMLLGMSPSAVRIHLHPEAFVDTIGSRLQRQERPAAHPDRTSAQHQNASLSEVDAAVC